MMSQSFLALSYIAFLENDETLSRKYIQKHLALNIVSLMQGYSDQEYSLLNSNFDESNNISLISNFTAEISNSNNEIISSLKNQMANTVRWTESIKKLEEIGETNIIEIGPNKVLSGLIIELTI